MEFTGNYLRLLSLAIIFSFSVSETVFADRTPAANSLDGDWAVRCHLEQSDMIQTQLNISGKKWLYTSLAFEDSGCLLPYIRYEELQNTLVLNGTDINVRTEGVYYTPLTDGTTRTLNQARFCGASDWKINVRKEVMGSSCQSVSVPNKGSTRYSRYRFTISELWLGIPSPGSEGNTPENRHTQFQTKAFERARR